MNAMPNNSGDDKGTASNISYCITGHSGDAPTIPFVGYDKKPENEKEKMQILQVKQAFISFFISIILSGNGCSFSVLHVRRSHTRGSRSSYSSHWKTG